MVHGWRTMGGGEWAERYTPGTCATAHCLLLPSLHVQPSAEQPQAASTRMSLHNRMPPLCDRRPCHRVPPCPVPSPSLCVNSAGGVGGGAQDEQAGARRQCRPQIVGGKLEPFLCTEGKWAAATRN